MHHHRPVADIGLQALGVGRRRNPVLISDDDQEGRGAKLRRRTNMNGSRLLRRRA